MRILLVPSVVASVHVTVERPEEPLGGLLFPPLICHNNGKLLPLRSLRRTIE